SLFVMLLISSISAHFTYTTLFRSRQFLEQASFLPHLEPVPIEIADGDDSQSEEAETQKRELEDAAAPSRRRRCGIRVLLQGSHRSEEHTSELQSRENLVCRLLLEK